MIVLDHVSKSFGEKVVLKDVSFRVDPKEFVCVSGPSGCGKTVLVEMLVGATPPTSGTVSIDSVDLHAVPEAGLQLFRRRLGIVFQDLKLLPLCTVEENVQFPLEICGAPEAWSKKRVNEVLKAMGIADLATKFPHELAGGDKARVSIARAIVHKPMIIVADEPTANLDPQEATEIVHMLKAIHKGGTTVILCTHDSALVDVLQARVVRIEDGVIVRDSVGGYERASRVQPKAANAAAHEIFGLESVEALVQETANTESKNEEDNGKRKVRITSINS